MNHRTETTQRVTWHGYRWTGPESLLRSRTDFPPKATRGWRSYPELCVGGWSDIDNALTWLWEGMNQVYRDLVSRYPRRAIALNDEYRAAEHHLLNDLECACQWSIRLPDEYRLCLAIVAVYGPNALPSNNGNPMRGDHR